MSTPDHISPPKWPLKLLRFFVKEDYLEEIEGDMEEIFQENLEQFSEQKAKWAYAWEVLKLLRPNLIKNLSHNSSPGMLQNNIKIAFRQMSRQKGFTAIKIGGFALGIAACLLISLYIRDELSYDKHFLEGDRIYWLYNDFHLDNGRIESGSSFPAPTAKTIQEDFPEVEMSARFNNNPLFYGPGSNQVRRENTQHNNYEEGFVYADQGILDIFQFPMIYGDPKTALTEPNTIVISEEKAKNYFPNQNPVGQSLILNNDSEQPFKITGVLKAFPSTSHIQYDFFLSLAGHEFWNNEQNSWTSNNYDVYVKLKPNTDAKAFEKKLERIIANYIGPAVVERGYREKVEDLLAFRKIRMEAVEDLHLYASHVHVMDSRAKGDIHQVWFFGAIALFILILASINFINLTTAKSVKRSKEVGIRKVLGSMRQGMINQFLTESILYSFFSFSLGIFLAAWFLPIFNRMSDKTLDFPWATLWFLPLLFLSMLLVGLLSGLYPAFYLSKFKPIEAFRGKSDKGTKSVFLQNGLVVFQFSTAIVLIISTMVIYQQMQYILNKNLGFDKEQVVLIQGAQTLKDKVLTFKEELLQLPRVKHVSVSDYLPVSHSKRNTNAFWLEGQKEAGNTVSTQKWRVDHDYLQTMGIKLIKGRDFNLNMPGDSQAVIINQRMATELDTNALIGARISNGRPYQIIGIMENFHFESMKDEIRPLCLIIGNSPQTIAVKIVGEDMATVIPTLTRLWDQFSPHQPIRYGFLDERFASMYNDVQRTGWVFTCFTILAIVVACLGLFALATFLAEQRSKEISIRKILGASIINLFGLLTQNFLQLIFLSAIVAVPIAWYLMRRWLQNYEYNIDLSAELFLFPGLIVFCIALVTISRQAFLAAVRNPVDAIRTE